MLCSECGSSVQPDFAFCPRCGARLGAGSTGRAAASQAPGPAAADDPRSTGPSSRSPSAAAYRGAAAGGDADRPDEGDRRLVTVLFADLSGFTALSERLDPEDVRALQNDLFRELSGAIERYDGFVEKFVGDAVMAVFGAPRAHEDDPERALHAALLMHDRVTVLNESWERRLGKPLALHVGVNTGPVVAGTIGSAASGAYAVTGDTVNTAARLQSAAGAAETLVSPTTHVLTEHAFVLIPVGEIPMKGKSQPLPAFRLKGAHGTRRSGRGLEALGLRAPMVGRTEELAQMVDAFDRMRRGRAQVVSVVGEAGVGKSRLLQEWLATLEAGQRLGSVAVRHAVCSSLVEQPYSVFAAFFREGYGVATGDPLEAARQKLASGLATLGGDEAETATLASLLGYVLGIETVDRFRHVEPEQLKRQVTLAIRRLVERRLQQGPLVLTVENLQWADVASVDLLQEVMDRLADQPLMLVASYRPSLERPALATTRVAHTALRLVPLSVADSEVLLAAYLGESAVGLPPALREVVLARAGGQPLYLEEILRGLIAGRVLRRGARGWICTAEAAVDVPPTIHGLLRARLDRLPDAIRRTLQEAAILGPVFDSARLREIASDPAGLDGALERLEESDFVETVARPGDGSPGGALRRLHYQFTNALVQEVAHQSLLLRRRTELHTRAAQALERAIGEAPTRLEDIEALARHWSAGGDRRKGARYHVAAGDWARGLYANEDAIRHYERALTTLAEGGDGTEDVWRVRERLGDLLAPLGHRAAAVDHYEAILAAAGEAGERLTQARLERKLAAVHWDAGDRLAAAARLQAGLRHMEGQPEHIELAHVYQEMGRQAFRCGDNQSAMSWAERALSQAERLARTSAAPGVGDADGAAEVASAMARAYNTLGVALARTGRLRDAVGHIERGVAVAEAHNLMHAACRGYTNLGVLYSTLDPKRAIDTCARGLEMAKRIGDLGLQSRLNTNLAVAYCALTNRCEEQGLVAAQTALDLDRQLGQLDHLAVPMIVLGQIQQCHGDPELALGHYREALSLVEQSGEPQLLFPCYDGLATLYLDRGDHARAEEFMQKAQQVCDRAGLDPDSFMVLPFLE
jgi:adenylate cyclase